MGVSRVCRARTLIVGVAATLLAGLVLAPQALAVGDWTYTSSGSPSSSPTDEIQLTWNAESSNAPRYEVFTLPVSFDPSSVWCVTQDGHDGGVVVGEPDGNPDEFECNFGAYNTSAGGAAGVTTTVPMPCDGAIDQKFSWDGSTFYPEDDLTPPGCGGGGQPGGGGPPGGSPNSSPSLTASAKPSTKARGATVLVDPGIRETCPAGGPACSAVERATARVRPSAGTKTVKLVLAQTHFTIPAGKTAKLTFKLGSRDAKLLRKLKSVRLTLTVTSRVDGNAAVTTTKQITIKAPH
jgi:hypothetical protein